MRGTQGFGLWVGFTFLNYCGRLNLSMDCVRHPLKNQAGKLILPASRDFGTSLSLGICATVNIMDSRAMLRMDVEFCSRTMLWPLLKPLCRIHVLWAYRNIDQSSYGSVGSL